MIRVLVAVALLFIAAAAFAWLAENPGDLTLTWQGYEVRTSLMVAAIIVAIGVALLAAIGAILRAILTSPQSLGHFLGARRRERGYRALTRGMVAVGAGDARLARRAAGEAKALLGSEPLVLLLSAQAAQIAGDGAAARTAFEALSADQETRVLGLHGLFVEARRQSEHTAARHFAEEAMRIAPRVPWAGTALFEYQSRAGDWQGALATLALNTGSGVIGKDQARRYRAVLDTARAMELEAGDPDEARGLAVEAHKLAPDLVPAAVIAARLLVRRGDIRRAARILEATWKATPHPEIAEAYAAVRPGDSGRDRMKRVRRLAELRANHQEGAIVMARAAIDARDWPAARAALAAPLRLEPTERICLMMAEIEEGEFGDEGRVRGWLTRALTAAPDPVWTADGQVFDHWAPVSPATGKLDAFEWRVVGDRQSVARARLDLATRDDDERQVSLALEAAPSASPAPPPPPPPAAPPSPIRSNAPRPMAATVLPTAISGPAPAAPGAARPRPMARAPDDPGPESPEEEAGAPLPLFRPGRMA